MRWLICGTVPDDAFPLCMGTWKVEDGRLVPADVKVCGEGELPPAVPVERGTPALAAAAILALEALGGEAPLLLLAGIICVGFAATDEYHQSMVANRGPSITDVGIDSIGALIGITLVRLFSWIALGGDTRRRRRRRRR